VTEDHDTLAMYLHLARASELRRRWMVRDKLLLISAHRAETLELAALAEHCRERILAHNSGHLVGHFPTLADAAADERFVLLYQQAERTYSAEKAEYMLQSLGIELGRAEATYATPEEYLASILGPPPLMDADRPTSDAIADIELPPADSTPEAALDIDAEWPAPLKRPLSETELAAREQSEFRVLCGGLVGLTVGILAWGVFLLRR
jgi:hypothetical protein